MTNLNESFDISAYPPLPALRGLFITGTDTGVGKTLIAGAIARRLRSLGKKIEVFKPVATGCRRGPGDLYSEDAEFLAACADSTRSLSDIVPIRYAAAVAPNVAARRERRPIDLPAMFDAYRSLAGAADEVVVEGVGGLLCPIADDFWVIHFAKMTQLPLVIVARAGVGTINHTLLTLHAARTAGIHVAGVVINDYLLDGPYDLPLKTDPQSLPKIKDDVDLAMFTNPQEIIRLGQTKVLAIVPHEKNNSVEKATIGPNTSFSIAQTDWEALMG